MTAGFCLEDNVTKTIQLTRGKVALVDDADFEWLNTFKWCYSYGYAIRKVGWPNRKTQWMHREIAGTPAGMITDHINGDKLDNRRSNLRACNSSENKCNAVAQSNNTSGYKGVSWNKRSAKWEAQICVNRRGIHLGYFDTAEAAAKAYDEACIKLHGEFARTNKNG